MGPVYCLRVASGASMGDVCPSGSHWALGVSPLWRCPSFLQQAFNSPVRSSAAGPEYRVPGQATRWPTRVVGRQCATSPESLAPCSLAMRMLQLTVTSSLFNNASFWGTKRGMPASFAFQADPQLGLVRCIAKAGCERPCTGGLPPCTVGAVHHGAADAR